MGEERESVRKRFREQAGGARLVEQAGGAPVARVVMIRAGTSLNGVEYPPDVLAAAAHLYNDKPCLLDHSWAPSVRDIAGWFRNARWNPDTQAIEADLHFLDTDAGRVLLALAREQERLRSEGLLGEDARLFGFSHVVFADVEVDRNEDGSEKVTAKEIVEVLSVDAVVFPAAGGEMAGLKTSREVAEGCQNPEVVKEAVERAVRDAVKMQERATRFRDLPLAERTRPWDGGAARMRLRKWASTDGSGDKETIDWSKYRWGFFWYDHTDPEKFGSYKLPFADILGGDIYAIPRGIFAAAGVIMGARGGADIPEEDIPGVKRHIAAYYRKMAEEWDEPDLVPPWEREEARLNDEEAAAFIEAFGLDAFTEAFGYSPGAGDSTTEPVETREEVESMKEKDTKKTEGLDEKAIREQIAAEFAEKMKALIEENRALQERVKELEEKVKAYEHEKAEAERKAKLDELFQRYGVEGAARQALEGVVADMDLEKAEQVIKLAAGTPKERDPEPGKKVQESAGDNPVEVGLKYAQEVFGINPEELL